jgi:alkanesulfonate monooxygenase SsuD/methylene tetrahydromethanopterin reductase-like flavin-dependent oxidoreductase (luciferase family)
VAAASPTLGVDYRSRWGRFWEAMEILRRSYSEDSLAFEGKYFSIPDPIRQTTKPKQSPFPLWVGGFGPKLQYRSGTLGYYHSQNGPDPHPEYLRGLAEAGVDPATRNHASFTAGHVAGSRHEAWEQCREGWWNRQHEYRKRTWIAHPDAPALPPFDEFLKMEQPPTLPGLMAPVVGTPDEVLEQLRPLYEHSGTTHFSFFFRACGAGMPHEQTRAAMKLFAEECLPTLRTWGREPMSSRAVG